ncbi:MAG: right-handed parallel beta-helix repeat-containing protein [Planctomycetota bacterium]|jgi:parallel beta-helix repeat protein
MNQIVVGVAVAVLASATQAITIYVDDDNCPGPGDGTQGNPYCSIQMAIDNAWPAGDEIIVHPGTYYEYIDFIGKAIWLHSSDGPEVTTIDAQEITSVVACVSGEMSDTVLEGFTIKGGSALYGGGMYNFGSEPTVINCIFKANAAYYGGGMCNLGMPGDVGPGVMNCTFSNNLASQMGGGMYNEDSSPTVTGCTFEGNIASHGGGMYNWANSNPTVTNCMFSENSTEYFGGGMYNYGSSPTVTNCTFRNNSAMLWSGGIYSLFDSLTEVADSTFCDNSPNHIQGTVHLSGQIDMSTFCPIPVCPSDTDGNGVVDVVDFLALLANWGVCPPEK